MTLSTVAKNYINIHYCSHDLVNIDNVSLDLGKYRLQLVNIDLFNPDLYIGKYQLV